MCLRISKQVFLIIFDVLDDALVEPRFFQEDAFDEFRPCEYEVDVRRLHAVRQDFAHLPEPVGELLAAVVVGKPEVGVQSVTQVVTVENVGDDTGIEQTSGGFVGDGRFTRAGQPGQPDGCADVSGPLLPVGPADGVLDRKSTRLNSSHRT